MQTSKIKLLEEKLMSCKNRLVEIKEVVRKRDFNTFVSRGGCTDCDGRGWIVSWDTLDCIYGSYAQYSSCPNDYCTKESRHASGLKPRASKYDRMQGTMYSPNYTLQEASELCNIDLEITNLDRKIAEENAIWSVTSGKVVEVKRTMRGRKVKRVPVGTVGIVQKVWTSSWGTQKAIILDEHGTKWWPSLSCIDVIDPNPKKTEWKSVLDSDRKKNGIPVVVTIKAKSQKAVLVLTSTGKEFWVPISQAPDLEKARKGDTVSAYIPLWVAKKSKVIGE